MKKCKINKRLSLYIAEEVSSAERVIIENHLKSCNECKNELNELQSDDTLINEFLSDYNNEELSPYLSDKLASIPQKYNKDTKISQVIVKFSIAASLLLSFSLGILMTNEIAASNDSYEFSSSSLADMESLYSYAGE